MTEKTSPFLECLNEKAHPLEVYFYEDYETSNWDNVLSQKVQPNSGHYLYHYTNQQGAFGILESKSIWASDPIFLNDKQEMRLGISALDKAFAGVKSEKPEDYEKVELAHGWLTEIADKHGNEFNGLIRQRAYTVSLTTKPDDLSQWRGYGGAAGVALGFELNLLEGARPQPFFAPLLYGTETMFTKLLHEDIIYTLENLNYTELSDRNNALITRYATLLPLIKHEAFETEQEWRLVVTGDRMDSLETEWRSTFSYAIPYTKVALWKNEKQTPFCVGGKQLSPSQPDRKPHEGCYAVLGPGASDLAEHYFDSKLNSRFGRSSVPYRI